MRVSLAIVLSAAYRSITIGLAVASVLFLCAAGATRADPLPAPFDTPPFDTDLLGASARAPRGFFQEDGGQQQWRLFIGTEPSLQSPFGLFIMDFAVRFTDGPGDDFAILTSADSWGPLASLARFDFFLEGILQTSFTAALSPDQIFQFELPGTGVIANRVVLANVTPDPPGINNLATMTFDNAGVAHVVAEPSTIFLLALAGVGLLTCMRRRWVQRVASRC
jgi:hypothetical protein